MSRKIKGFGLALVAIAAMSMAAASLAQASELHATTPGSASIFGTRPATDTQNQFVIKSGAVICQVIALEGTITNSGQSQQQTTAQEGQLTPTYSGCKLAGIAANVIMNGCKYTITNKNASGVTTALTAFVDIVGCTAGKHIEISVVGSNCIVTVPAQNNLSDLKFTNNTAQQNPPHDVTVDIAVTGITYEVHGNECPNNPTQTLLTHDGQYQGQLTFQARVDDGFTQVTKHGHLYDELKPQGALVGLQAT